MDLSPQLLDGVAARLPPAALVTLADAAPGVAAALAPRLRVVADTYNPSVEHTPETACLMAFWVRYWRIPPELRVGVYRVEPAQRKKPWERLNNIHGTPMGGDTVIAAARAGDLGMVVQQYVLHGPLYNSQALLAFMAALDNGHTAVCRWLVEDALWGDAKPDALQVALDTGCVGMVAYLLEHAVAVDVGGQAHIQFEGTEPRGAASMLRGAASACRRDVCELVVQWARPLCVRLCPSIEGIVGCDNRHDVHWFLRQRGTELYMYNLHPEQPWEAAFKLAATLPGVWRCAWVARWYGVTRAMLEGARFLPLRAAAEHGHAETVKWMVGHFDLGGAAVPDDVLFAAARLPDMPLCEWLSARLAWAHVGADAFQPARFLHALVEAQCMPACVWAVQRWVLTAADVHGACQGPDGAVMEAWLVEWCDGDADERWGGGA